VVITTKSKSGSLGWRRFETFLQEVVFFPIRIRLEDSVMDGFLGSLLNFVLAKMVPTTESKSVS
jgi:hypothetical protein